MHMHALFWQVQLPVAAVQLQYVNQVGLLTSGR